MLMLPKMGGDGVGISMRRLLLLPLLLLLSSAVNNVNSYSKYGRGCQDIGCLPTEECIISQDSCSYTQREGKDCGSYPTCKRKIGASTSSAGPVNPSGTSFKTGFESNIFSSPSASSSSSGSSSSSSSSSSSNFNPNGHSEYNGMGSSGGAGGGSGTNQNGALNTNNKAKNNNGNGHGNGFAPIDPHYVFGAPYSAPNIPFMPIFPYNAPTEAPSFQQFPQPNHPGSVFNPGLPHGLQPVNPYNPSFVFGPPSTHGNSNGGGGGFAPYYGLQNPNMYNKPPPQYPNQNPNTNPNTYNRQTQSDHSYSSAARVGGAAGVHHHCGVAGVSAAVIFGCIATLLLNILLQQCSVSFRHSTPLPPQQQHLQQQQHQGNAAAYSAKNIAVGGGALPANSVDTSDLMIRLRESIKQKEEFLKSPLPPHAAAAAASAAYSNQAQHFFPHTPASGSLQLSRISTSTTSFGSSSIGAGGIAHAPESARGQVRTKVKQPISATSSGGSSSSTRELLSVVCYDLQNSYKNKNIPQQLASGYAFNESSMNREIVSLPAELVGSTAAYTTAMTNSQHQQQQRQVYGNNGNSSSCSGLVSSLRDKYSKDLDYLGTLQEVGVTNKVFEQKGFDPFEPLSINTNALESGGGSGKIQSQTQPNNVAFMRKPGGVLYDSLQHHPFHQMQLQQPTTSNNSTTTTTLNTLQGERERGVYVTNHNISANHSSSSSSANTHSHSVIDGHCASRMEMHKASLTTTVAHMAPQGKYTLSA